MYIKIPKSAVDLDMINGANCSIEGCYESDGDNIFKIPTSSCIVGRFTVKQHFVHLKLET